MAVDVPHRLLVLQNELQGYMLSKRTDRQARNENPLPPGSADSSVVKFRVASETWDRDLSGKQIEATSNPFMSPNYILPARGECTGRFVGYVCVWLRRLADCTWGEKSNTHPSDIPHFAGSSVGFLSLCCSCRSVRDLFSYTPCPFLIMSAFLAPPFPHPLPRCSGSTSIPLPASSPSLPVPRALQPLRPHSRPPP